MRLCVSPSMTQSYPVAIIPHENGSYRVLIPDLPEFSAIADSFRVAQIQAKKAIEQYLEEMLQDKKAIPKSVDLAQYQMLPELSNALWMWVEINI